MMEKNNTKLFLEVDASQIDVKQLLKKDFLELSMRAISSANPNKNNSWFTEESMETSLDSFINKPILGYFENGDFVSHNGDWTYDSETEMNYWDTLGKKGERILGIIRESDERKIVQDSKGLSWITFTCALWTQYSFKQVKRLIKDAKRAQKTGESTKNISVEVDITDYEMLDNGVMKINAFNLVGVTILGSRNGVKVEPGIEDAELSVVDIMGRDVYSAQEQTLRLAYEKLNNSVENKEESQVENTENKNDAVLETLSAEETAVPETQQDFGCETHEEEACPECGKNPCECDSKQNEGCGNTEQHEEEGADDDTDTDEGQSDDDAGDDDEHKEPEHESCDCGACECESAPDPIHDIAWLISDCSWNLASLKSAIEYYGNSEVESKDYIVAVLNRLVARQVESEQELATLLATVVAGVSEENQEYEAKLAKYSDVNALISNYESAIVENARLVDELSAANEKVANFEHQEFINKASALIASAKLDDAQSAKFMNACEAKEITTLDDLKVQVAVSAFEAQTSATHEAVSFTAPVSAPDITAAFTDKHAKTHNNGDQDRWSTLHEYIGK